MAVAEPVGLEMGMEEKPAPVAPMMVEGVGEVLKPELVGGVVNQSDQPAPALPEDEPMPDLSTLDLTLPPKPELVGEAAKQSDQSAPAVAEGESMPDVSTLDLALPPKPPAALGLE